MNSHFADGRGADDREAETDVSVLKSVSALGSIST